MNKKIILLMAAVIIALICISPIMASDDGFSVQNFLKFGDDTPSLEFEDLHILKLNREHTDSNGNVKKSTGFYLLFNLTSDSDSMGNYSVEINCFDKNGKLIDTINSYVDHEGKFKIPLKGVSKVESVNMTVKKDNGDVIVNVSTDVVKVDKKSLKRNLLLNRNHQLLILMLLIGLVLIQINSIIQIVNGLKKFQVKTKLFFIHVMRL